MSPVQLDQGGQQQAQQGHGQFGQQLQSPYGPQMQGQAGQPAVQQMQNQQFVPQLQGPSQQYSKARVQTLNQTDLEKTYAFTSEQ